MRTASGVRTALAALAVWSPGSAAWGATPCGAKGTIAERIASCARPTSQGGQGLAARKVVNPALDGNKAHDPLMGLNSADSIWVLIAQDAAGRQAWLDETSGMAWGGSTTAGGTTDPEAFCKDPAVKLSLDLSLRLETLEDIRIAYDHGVLAVLPGLARRVFYIKDGPDKWWNGSTGQVVTPKSAKETGFPRSVTCLARGAGPKPPKK